MKTPIERAFIQEALENTVDLARRGVGNEYNAPATILMLCEALDDGFLGPDESSYRRGIRGITREAEIAMLQLALIQEGCNPGSVFLNNAVSQGWRFRPGKGFYLAERVTV